MLKTPWPICSTCQAIPLTIFQEGATSEPYRLWATFSSFANSASMGCHTCTLLYEAVSDRFVTRLISEPVFLERGFGPGDGTQIVALTVDPDSLQDRTTWDDSLWKRDDDQRPSFHFAPIAHVKHVLDAKDVPQSQRHFKDLISLYAENDGVFRFIKQSLTDCLMKHNLTCNRVMFPHPSADPQRNMTVNIVHGAYGLTAAPTRLLYVGSEATQEPPRLVDGQECLVHGYVVLSYCWGMTPKAAPWQLTTATMQQFLEAVPLTILPQTLHDAIMWTRKLGMHYIWIDSMCILQDSMEDWQYEASRMGSTYGSATLTLVAASSSVYGGMTDWRNPLRNTAGSLELQDEHSSSTIYLLPNGQPRDAPLSPTDSRGWCYQEDLLSSRLVKMTRKQVVWQCVADGSKPNPRAQGLEQLAEHPSYKWYILWYRLIERYTSKNLTYPKDKPIAFYAIAMDKIGWAYIGGVLKTDPWASLLWCRDETQIRRRPGRRYDEYVAPTWSWIGIDAPVLFYEASARHTRKAELDSTPMEPSLHHIGVQQASSIETGAMKSGMVELSAYVSVTCTASVQPFLFNTRQGSHTYGRRNCIDPTTREAVGLVVFDVATEAWDDMELCCVLLQTAAVGLWEKNGTAGLGLAVRVHEETADHLKATRVGYVQFTPAFGALCHKRRLVLS